MKFIYNLLQNIAEKLCAPSLVTSFNWGGSYTPAYSGIMLMRVRRTSDTAGSVTFYVKDTTAGEYGIGALATGSISGGFQNTICFPVIKGHTYETEYSYGVQEITCRFYKVPSWGGYCVASNVLSRLVERWWEHEDRMGNSKSYRPETYSDINCKHNLHHWNCELLGKIKRHIHSFRSGIVQGALSVHEHICIWRGSFGHKRYEHKHSSNIGRELDFRNNRCCCMVSGRDICSVDEMRNRIKDKFCRGVESVIAISERGCC